MGDIIHPTPGINHLLVCQTDTDKEELRIHGHAAIYGARSASTCNARTVRAVVSIVIHIAGVALRTQQSLSTDIFCAIVKAFRCGARCLELVPCAQHAIMDHVRVIEDRVRIVETPVGDTDNHALTRELLRQIEALPDTVQTCILRSMMQQRLRIAHQYQN